MMESLETRLNFSPVGTGWQLMFADEFSGTTLDANKWSVQTNARRDATNSADSVSVANGSLALTTHTEAGKHYTGFINTKTKFSATYGYWEASIKFNDSPGMWSAFWVQSPTIGTESSPPNPAVNGTEIDVAEHRFINDTGSDVSNVIQNNLHWNGYNDGITQNTGGGNVANPSTNPLQGNYHLYAVAWDPTGYKFYIDGTQVWQTSQGVSKRSEFIYLTSEVQSGIWAGNIPSGGYGTLANSTTKMNVSFVHVYQKPVLPIADAYAPPSTAYSIPITVAQEDDLSTTVTATSSNTAIVPNANIVISGTGANRTLTVTPTSTLGATTITINASNSNLAGSTSFVLNVSANGSFTNGGFENTPAGQGWSLTGSAAIVTTQHHSGTQAARINGSSGTATQLVAGLKPNTTYVITGWANVSATRAEARIGVKNYGGTDTWAATSSVSWTNLSLTFTTGSTATSATIYCFKPTTTDAANFDDLTITPQTQGAAFVVPTTDPLKKKKHL